MTKYLHLWRQKQGSAIIRAGATIGTNTVYASSLDWRETIEIDRLGSVTVRSLSLWNFDTHCHTFLISH